MNVLPHEQQVRIIGALLEGCSIRATERLTSVHRDTIMRLGVKIGNACRNLHDSMIYVVGKRTSKNAMALAADLRSRILNRPQITADGYAPYIGAIDRAFGVDVDFATIEKEFQAPPAEPAAHRYSPSSIRAIEKTIIRGTPDPDKISTSYIERFNLTTRMQLRRFTRLTNGFSKKLENHRAAIALYIAHYNLCRVHETLKVTPAMELGVTNYVWSISDLIDAALLAPEAPATPPPPPTTMRPGYRPLQLRVIRGGKVR